MIRNFVRVLVTALVTPVLLGTQPAYAQDAATTTSAPVPMVTSCDPIIPRRNQAGYSDDPATLRQNAIDILTATFIANSTWARTLAPADGEAVITSGQIASDTVILRAPVRHARVGRTNADVFATPVFRDRFMVLPEGAEVWQTVHITEYQCRRDEVLLWCGQRRAATEFRHELQCFMPPESGWQGIAQLRGNQYFPWGFAKFIDEAEHGGVTEQEIITAPPMEIRIEFTRWRGNTPELRSYVWIEGMDEGDDTSFHVLADVREDERGAIVSLWGGELLLRKGADRNAATVEILLPITGFDVDLQNARMRELATARVDQELGRRARR